MSLSPGDRLGPYEIIAPLGRGGMGEVFRARDPRLGRDVAIKILPAGVAADATAVSRFEQEARAVAALSHPNIVAIHDVGRSESVSYVVTELLEGETLRDRLAHGRLSVRKAIEIGQQIAQGLAAAHAKGIVHRDIKPDNIFLTADGHAKILDFGLAKVERGAASDETTVAGHTDPGTVLGTTGYLSPEQAAARSADARSDTFSFGAVLYEMVTGVRAFKGDSTIDTLHAIVHDQPPPIDRSTPDAPAELRWILDKCLAKDADDRYQSTRDLVVDLKNAARVLDSSPKLPVTPAAASATKSRTPLLIGGSVVLLVVIASSLVMMRRSAAPAPGGSSAVAPTMERVTALGTVIDAAISPDGKYVAYVTSENGRQGMSLRQLATASTLELLPPASVGFWGMAWAPDGNSIYYTLFEVPGGRSVYRIAVLGGTPRKILSGAESEPTFSPDGKRLAIVRQDFPSPGESALVVADIDGQNVRTLATRKPPEFFAPIFFTAASWSPDGTTIVVPMTRRDGPNVTGTLVALNANDGSAMPFPHYEWPAVGHVAWTPDGEGVIVVGGEGRANPLWYVSAKRQEQHRITNDLLDYRKATVTSDGKMLVAVVAESTSAIWVAPMDGKTDSVRISAGRYDGISGVAAVRGGRLLYRSVEGGNANVWVMDETGANRKQVTTEGGVEWPVATPDGQGAIYVRQEASLWRAGIQGGAPVSVAQTSSAYYPDITPDGKTVYFTAVVSGVSRLLRMPIGGGRPESAADFVVQRPAVSPDGTQLALYFNDGTHPEMRLGVMPIGGTKVTATFEKIVPSVAYAAVRWTIDGTALLHNSGVNDRANIWLQPLNGGEPRPVTHFGDQNVMAFDRSVDGSKLYITRGTLTRDAVLIKNFR